METTKNNANAPLMTGVDIIGLVFRKWKLIVCLSLILAVLVSVGAFFLTKDNTTYGNSVNFYLSRKDPQQVLLPILQSESFAEKLLLDEYGLPEELAGTNNAKYEEAKAAVIAFKKSKNELKEVQILHNRIGLALTTPKDPYTGETISSLERIEHEYQRLVNSYNSINTLLTTYKSANTDGIVTEGHLKMTEELEARLEVARQEREAYKKSAYDPAQLEVLASYETYMLKMRATNDLKAKADELVEGLLVDWRNDEDVQKKIGKIMNAMTFGYIIPEQTEDALPDNVSPEKQNQVINFSFIKVSVAVVGDEELANLIISRLKRTLPLFVETSLDSMASTADTECELISTFSAAQELDRESSVTTLVLAFGLTFIAVAVIAAIAVVCAEWLRRSGVIKTKEKSKKAAA